MCIYTVAPTATCCCTSRNPWRDTRSSEPAKRLRGDIRIATLLCFSAARRKGLLISTSILVTKKRGGGWRHSSKARPHLKQCQGWPMMGLHLASCLPECSKHSHLHGRITRFKRKQNERERQALRQGQGNTFTTSRNVALNGPLPRSC